MNMRDLLLLFQLTLRYEDPTVFVSTCIFFMNSLQLTYVCFVVVPCVTPKVTIDTLRKDLASARERCAEDVANLTASLSSLREENDRLTRMCESTELKDQQIFALEKTLHAQENTVER